MELKVVKFGGSSLADAEHFRKVAAIIKEEDSRRYVVASAPGKRSDDDEKVTDMLYECFELAQEDRSIDEVFSRIIRRYKDIIHDLGLKLDLSKEFATIKTLIEHKIGRDYAASRGEYLNAMILADFMGYDFVDAADIVRFKDNGVFDSADTRRRASKELKKHERAVVPGFYGKMHNGSIRTFSRGGSDITGSIVACAVEADIYENWTDVSGMLMADPRCVPDPEPIATITYKELRELSYMGATVLHDEAIFPVREVGIPINIRNTNDPDARGTFIVPTVGKDDMPPHQVTGVAGHKGFMTISVEKDMMNSELGFGRKVLAVLEKHGVSFEHLPSGIDTLSVIVDEKSMAGIEQRVIDDICRAVEPDTISVERDIALIAVVGRGLVSAKGTAGRVFTAIGDAGVNIKMIDQGSSELNIIVGVSGEDYVPALRAIYNEFVK